MSEDVNYVQEAQDNFEMMVEKRYRQFGVDELKKRQENIDSLIEESSNLLKDVKNKLYKVIYLIMGEPNRKCIRKSVTIRDGDIYEYNETYSAPLSNVLYVEEEILDEIPKEHEESLRKIFSRISLCFSDIYNLRYTSGNISKRNLKSDYIEDYVWSSDSSGTYMYYKGNRIQMMRGYRSIKRALRSYSIDSFDFRSSEPDNIIDAGEIPLEDIRKYLSEIEEKFRSTRDKLIHIIDMIEEYFAPLLVSLEI